METMTWSDTLIDYNSIGRNVNWLADSRAFLFSLEGGRDIHAIRLVKPYPSLGDFVVVV